jgi:hypothetical protein
MNIDYQIIEELFRAYDFEDLISAGAPDNEYEPEVERICSALQAMPREQATTQILETLFEDVWRHMFGTTDEGIVRRRPDFTELAEKVMHLFG